MRTIYRLLSVLVCMAVLGSSFIFTASSQSPSVRMFEAENLQGDAGTRTVLSDRIRCDRTANSAGYCMSVPVDSLESGNYRIVLSMCLLEELQDTSQYILQFDLYGDSGSGVQKQDACTAWVIRSQFSMINKFQTVSVRFTTTVPLTNVQLRFKYSRSINLEVDKLALLTDDALYLNAEAESTYSEVPTTGAKKPGEGLLVQSGAMNQCLAMVTGVDNLSAGRNIKVSVHMRVLSKTGNANTAVTSVSILTKTATAGLAEKQNTPIRESSFPNAYRYYTIEIPYTLTEDVQSLQIWVWAGSGNYNPSSFEIDRVEITDAAMNTQIANSDAYTYEAEAGMAQENTRSVTSDGLAIESDLAVNTSGACVFGASLQFDPGTYKITAVMKVSSRTADTTAKFATFDLYGTVNGTAEVNTTNAFRDVQFPQLDTWTNIDLYFKTEQTMSNVQIRLWTQDVLKFQVDKFIIQKLDDNATMVYQAENTPESMTGVFTSEGVACADGSKADWATCGSYAVLDPGKYNISVYVKQTGHQAADANKTIFTFQLNYVNGGQSKSGYTTAFAQKDFPSALNTYKAFTVPVEVYEGERFSEIQLMAGYSGFSDIVIDRFEIVKTGDAEPAPVRPFFQVEAESMPRLIGFPVGSGVVCIKGMGATCALYGTDVNIPAGDWRVVVYMKLLNKSGSGDALAAQLDINCNPGGGAKSILYLTDIKESQFAQVGQYYAIVIPISTAVELQHAELRIQYPNNLGIEVDKLMVLQQGIDVPEPTQDPETGHTRPDGVSAYDEYNVPLTSGNIQFSSSDTGDIENGSIRFNVEEDTVGSVTGETDPIYLTGGDKIARFYLRTPKQVVGTIDGSYTFLELILMKDGIPIALKNYTAADFYAHTNEPLVCDIPFTTDENTAISFAIKWNGSYDTCIDKVIFKSSDETDIQTHILPADEGGPGNSLTLRAQDISDYSVIDNLQYTFANGLTVTFPVAYISEWLAGQDSVELATTGASKANLNQVRRLLNAFDADLTDILSFDLSIVLHAGDGDTALDITPYLINMSVPVSGSVSLRSDTRALGYIVLHDGKVYTPETTLSKDGSNVSLRTGRVGMFYVGLISNYVASESGSGSDSGNSAGSPKTADRMTPGALLALLIGAVFTLSGVLTARRILAARA